MPKVKEDFRNGGVQALGTTPERFNAIVHETYDQWAKVATQLNFKKE